MALHVRNMINASCLWHQQVYLASTGNRKRPMYKGVADSSRNRMAASIAEADAPSVLTSGKIEFAPDGVRHRESMVLCSRGESFKRSFSAVNHSGWPKSFSCDYQPTQDIRCDRQGGWSANTGGAYTSVPERASVVGLSVESHHFAILATMAAGASAHLGYRYTSVFVGLFDSDMLLRHDFDGLLAAALGSSSNHGPTHKRSAMIKDVDSCSARFQGLHVRV